MTSSNEGTNDEDIVGSHYRITFCDDAESSLREALRSVTKKRGETLAMSMYSLLKRKANGEPMSHGSDVKEATLPDGSHFRAIKKIPLRCYYWVSKTLPAQIFVSHFKYKDKNGLDSRDTDKVVENWRAIEKPIQRQGDDRENVFRLDQERIKSKRKAVRSK